MEDVSVWSSVDLPVHKVGAWRTARTYRPFVFYIAAGLTVAGSQMLARPDQMAPGSLVTGGQSITISGFHEVQIAEAAYPKLSAEQARLRAERRQHLARITRVVEEEPPLSVDPDDLPL